MRELGCQPADEIVGDMVDVIAGRVGLLLRSARRDDAPDSADWAEITPLGLLDRSRRGEIAEQFRLYRVVGRAGAELIAVMPRPGSH